MDLFVNPAIKVLTSCFDNLLIFAFVNDGRRYAFKHMA